MKWLLITMRVACSLIRMWCADDERQRTSWCYTEMWAWKLWWTRGSQQHLSNWHDPGISNWPGFSTQPRELKFVRGTTLEHVHVMRYDDSCLYSKLTRRTWSPQFWAQFSWSSYKVRVTRVIDVAVKWTVRWLRMITSVWDAEWLELIRTFETWKTVELS